MLKDNIFSVNIIEELKSSFRDYSMSVIIGRALPDVRDGLKPVHRRILYAMFTEGLFFSGRFSKCAGIVGEVLKKYHPHGDSSVYEALVRMAQPWNLRELLIKGQGNFGSIDGDSAAAYRYTEAKLSKIAEELLVDIKEDTVDFVSNYDGSTVEPLILPSKIPNLLVNGSEGIAVAIATKCPPHNLGEIIDGLLAIIAEEFESGPEVDFSFLHKIIPAPDFPTGGIICGKEGVVQAQKTGRGSILLRGRVKVVQGSNKNQQIIIEEIPYQVNKANLLKRIAFLVRKKKINGIRELRDESDRNGMSIVIDLKNGVIGNVILNQLYESTPLQSSYSANMVAIVNQRPRILSLREMLDCFISFRREVVTRKIKNQLKFSEDRIHNIIGLFIACTKIDFIISNVKLSKNSSEAKEKLKKMKIKDIGFLSFVDCSLAFVLKWKRQGFAQFDDKQVSNILEMKLSRLVSLEYDKLKKEILELLKKIQRFKKILSNVPLLMNLIKDELLIIKDKYANKRRTLIVKMSKKITLEDMIEKKDVLVMISHEGYIKRTSLDNYKSQKRGGKGKKAALIKEKDFIENAFIASTHAYLLTFTNTGRVFWVKVYSLPSIGSLSRGIPIINLIKLKENEQVKAILPVERLVEDQEKAFVITSSKNGKVKKTDLKFYSKPRKCGLVGCGIEDGDELVAAKITNGISDVFLSTNTGKAIRFFEKEVRTMGRQAIGVNGIFLKEKEYVVSMEIVSSKDTILTVTEFGFGKKTKIKEYRKQMRGGKGIITIKVDKRNGMVADALKIEENNSVMIVTGNGKLICVDASSISEYRRNTKGVKLININKKKGEKVKSVVKILEN